MNGWETVFLDPASEGDPITARILQNLPGIPVIRITPDELLAREKGTDISLSKKRLFLTRDRGSQLKRCPGTRGRICCNYFVINQGIGCPFDCSYCFLQDFSNLPAIFIYTNVNELLQELGARLSENTDKFYRIGTGEMTDSLALDGLSGFSKEIVPFFRNFDNALLELKTKSAAVENLLELNPDEKTVISWSLNPQRLIDSDEKDAASLENRLRAARLVQQAGYKLAFHFDPVVLYPGWEEEYKAVINAMAEAVDTSGICWISLGSFRYRKSMKEVMDSRFPKSTLTSGEHVMSNDGKMRYFLPQRVNAYRKLKEMLYARNPDLFLYLCMEDSNVWEAVFGSDRRPSNMLEVDRQFRESLNRRNLF